MTLSPGEGGADKEVRLKREVKGKDWGNRRHGSTSVPFLLADFWGTV